MLVDDEKILLDIFEDFLTGAGFDVIKKDNGSDALEFIGQDPPDLVLLDLNMPGVSGLEVLDIIQDLHPEIPVIIVSGVGDIRSVLDALRRGAWDFILKPIRETDILVHSIHNSLERARLIRENKLYQEELEKMVTVRTSELIRRGAILDAVSYTAQRYLKARNVHEALPDILESLGRAAEVSHIFILKTSAATAGENFPGSFYIWPTEDDPGNGTHYAQEMYSALFRRPCWREKLEAGVVAMGDTDGFTEEEQDIMKSGQIQAVMAAPVFVDGEWWGVMGFGDDNIPRQWSVYESEAVKTAANTLGIAMERLNKEAQLKIFLDEKDILLKEIHHRVKNNMAVMSGLLSLQARQENDPKLEAAFRESSARIRSMALVHEKLYQSHNLSNIDFGQYIESLIRQLTALYRKPETNIRVDVNASPVMLNIMKAIPCGLILNELFSNSLKYAFAGNAAGSIEVRFCKVNDLLELTIADSGVGIPDSVDIENPTSLGLQLVQMLTRQLGGEIKLDRSVGASFQLTFPEEKNL